MINRARIRNFKCLLDVEVELGPLTVFIGPNDSGKSSILDALYLLGQTASRAILATDPAWRSVFGANGDEDLTELVWRKDQGREIEWTVDGVAEGRGAFRYQLALPAMLEPEGRVRESFDGLVKDRDEFRGSPVKSRLFERRRQTPPETAVLYEALAQAISTTAKYRLTPYLMGVAAQPQPNPALDRAGTNLAAVLDGLMTSTDRSAIVALERTLQETLPSLRGVTVPTIKPVEGGQSLKTLRFALAGTERPPITIPARQVSDGALLLTAYLALAYSDTPEIILIEEPENGLHPSRLQMVVDILRRISTGEIGNRPRQVLVSTHSPILLNHARPEEVRIVRRNAEGATEVIPFEKAPDVRKLLEEFAIGELWYLLGEDGLLKGPAK